MSLFLLYFQFADKIILDAKISALYWGASAFTNSFAFFVIIVIFPIIINCCHHLYLSLSVWEHKIPLGNKMAVGNKGL